MINIGKLLQSQIEETSEGEEMIETEEVPVLTKEEILEAKVKQLEAERDKIKSDATAKTKEVPKKKGFFGKLKQVGEALEKDMNSIP